MKRPNSCCSMEASNCKVDEVCCDGVVAEEAAAVLVDADVKAAVVVAAKQ
jgi:hypothetical protein